MTVVEKFNYVRSEALRQAYRKIPCQHCARDDGTVCCAHSNWAEHGKGAGIKASDVYGASLCERCHYQLDQGRTWSAEQRKANWTAAHIKSVIKLVRLGYWPKDIDPPFDVRLGGYA